jgi:hypothetical protein
MPLPGRPAPRLEVGEHGFRPATLSAHPGKQVNVVNTRREYMTCTDSSTLRLWDSQLFRSARSHNSETRTLRVPWAGTFGFDDKVCGGKGTIAVVPRVERRSNGTAMVVVAERYDHETCL